ncbi:MAG TPA: hypothetical protein VLW25_10245 [Bryobacteraceae bacterium]|nr:hypothetical protein [Bryobacteraceae bacterium]
MPSNAYRLKDALIAVIQEDSSHLRELPAGSMFYCSSTKPDSHGMVKGMCKGHMVLIFASDLEERAEPLVKVI